MTKKFTPPKGTIAAAARLLNAPPFPFLRWTVSRKRDVTALVLVGGLSFEDAMRRHSLTANELADWLIRRYHNQSLRATTRT